ncbi:unnamed protein product [Calypogeia fissa]
MHKTKVASCVRPLKSVAYIGLLAVSLRIIPRPKAPRVTKRKRTDATGAAVADYVQIIGSLAAARLRNIFVQTAQQHPDFAASVVKERKKTVAREINFDRYSGLAQKALKVTYKGGRLTKLFNNAVDIVSKIQEYTETIGKSTASTCQARHEEKRIGDARGYRRDDPTGRWCTWI